MLLLFVARKLSLFSLLFKLFQDILKSFAGCRKNAHNSFPHVFCVNTLHLEAHVLDSYYHIWKTRCSSGFLTFPKDGTAYEWYLGQYNGITKATHPSTHPLFLYPEFPIKLILLANMALQNSVFDTILLNHKSSSKM